MTIPPTPPELTDRRQLARQRARAARAPAWFLHEAARDELKERLQEVNRTFTKPAIVTGAPDFWAGAFPGARIVADDPVGQIVQCRRALAPDGLFLAALFGGRTLHELRASLAEAEVALTGGLSPRIAPMAEIRELGGLLQRAGLALPVADSLMQEVRYATPLGLMHDLRAMGEGNALAARRRRAAPRSLFAEAARRYSEAFAGADGRVPASFEMIFLTGWAPHPDQQQPQRPGAALSRLADALGTSERSAGEKP